MRDLLLRSNAADDWMLSHFEALEVLKFWRRTDKILRVSQLGFEVLETQDPQDFLEYRIAQRRE